MFNVSRAHVSSSSRAYGMAPACAASMCCEHGLPAACRWQVTRHVRISELGSALGAPKSQASRVGWKRLEEGSQADHNAMLRG